MATHITLTADQAHDLISTLMRAAGRLSDIQELNGEDMDKFTNDLLNAAKSNIFDVIGEIDPRKESA
jgi:DNA-directed RNA polymerase subunit F